MEPTYSSYLRLDELLSLQQPLSEGKAHDEMLFIIIHQAYELWFKQILHELDHLRELLEKNDTTRSLHTLRRIITIETILNDQLTTLETMTPLQFLSFRPLLGSASGFQSLQFRELEFVLGHKDGTALLRFQQGSEARRRLEARYASPTLWDGFLRYLSHHYAFPEEVCHRDFTQPVHPSTKIQEVLLEVYQNNSLIAHLCELLLDLDEKFQEWRYRHVKMVERMIGQKQGTGGSSGVEYLKKTLFKPAFPDLWSIRTEFRSDDHS